MPYKEKQPVKRYWTIGEIATDMNVTTSCIRFYEKRLKLNVNRGKINLKFGKERRYKRTQYNNMIMFLSLMKTKLFTVIGAWLYVKQYRAILIKQNTRL